MSSNTTPYQTNVVYVTDFMSEYYNDTGFVVKQNKNGTTDVMFYDAANQSPIAKTIDNCWLTPARKKTFNWSDIGKYSLHRGDGAIFVKINFDKYYYVLLTKTPSTRWDASGNGKMLYKGILMTTGGTVCDVVHNITRSGCWLFKHQDTIFIIDAVESIETNEPAVLPCEDALIEITETYRKFIVIKNTSSNAAAEAFANALYDDGAIEPADICIDHKIEYVGHASQQNKMEYEIFDVLYSSLI